MEAMVDQAMRDGAFGLSSALIYVPGSFAKTEELVALARVAGAARAASTSRTSAARASSCSTALDEAITHRARGRACRWSCST